MAAGKTAAPANAGGRVEAAPGSRSPRSELSPTLQVYHCLRYLKKYIKMLMLKSENNIIKTIGDPK